jgi:hypothetical protein
VNEETLARVGPQRQNKTNPTIYFIPTSNFISVVSVLPLSFHFNRPRFSPIEQDKYSHKSTELKPDLPFAKTHLTVQHIDDAVKTGR